MRRGRETGARAVGSCSSAAIQPRPSERRRSRALDGDGHRHTVDLILGGVPAIASFQTRFELGSERFAADVPGVLFERLRDAIGCRIAHVDAVGDVEAGLLAGVLNQTNHGAGTTLSDQLGAYRRIENDKDTSVGGGREPGSWLE